MHQDTYAGQWDPAIIVQSTCNYFRYEICKFSTDSINTSKQDLVL